MKALLRPLLCLFGIHPPERCWPFEVREQHATAYRCLACNRVARVLPWEAA